MNDEEKSKKELIAELRDVRGELAALQREQAMDEIRAGSSVRRSLVRNVELFRALFEQASDSIFLMELIEGQGPIILDANRAACHSHGYEKHELVGQPISMLDTPETARHIQYRSERLLDGKRIFFEGAHRRKDGSEFPVEVSAQLIQAGSKNFILGVDRDISQHKAAEERLRAKARKLRESNQKLQGFAYLTSHELHAPLISTVRALGMLMQKLGPEVGPEEMGYLRSAKMSTEGMLATVRELINLSQHSDAPDLSARSLEREEKRV